MPTVNEYDYGMPVHPVCDLFPLMSADELTKLESDIRNHGLMNPVVVHDGQLVDGRNRVLASKAAGVTLRCIEWRNIYKGDEPLSRWIWSINGERLTTDQYVATEIALRAFEEQEAARLRQTSVLMKSAGPGRGHETVGVDSAPTVLQNKRDETKRSRYRLAKQLNVSEKTVQKAITLKIRRPELLKEVVRGTMTLNEAVKQVEHKATLPSKQTTSAKPKADKPKPLIAFVAGVLHMQKTIVQRRKENHAAMERRRWNVDNINKVELIKLLDWIEQQLHTITSDLPADVLEMSQQLLKQQGREQNDDRENISRTTSIDTRTGNENQHDEAAAG